MRPHGLGHHTRLLLYIKNMFFRETSELQKAVDECITCVCVCDGACATLAQKSGSNSSVCRACLSVHVSDMRGAGARHHMTMCHSDSSPLKTPNHDIVLNERMKHILNDMLGLLG